MFSTDHLAAQLPTLQKAKRLYVGYSGGLDSHVLLHAVVALVGSDKVTALHINHQISENANHWQAHCAEQCRLLNVPLQAFRVNISNSGEGIEQAARRARYEIFEAALEPGDLLLLGHHADDQAETVLYRMLRCSGPRGLAAMPRSRVLGKGQLLRPLLDFSRVDLASYAATHSLQWIDDESNQQLDYDRNFLRHNVVPAFQQRWPDLTQRLSEVAALCRATDDLNREIAEQDLSVADERPERFGCSIELDVLAGLSILRRHNLVRFWLERHSYMMPSKVRLERIHRELIEAREDASPIIDLGDCQLRRYRERVFLIPPLPAAPVPETEVHWDGKQPLLIAGAGCLQAVAGLSTLLTVCFRQGGERCQPSGREHSQSLKKLLHEYRLEPWLRDRVPLVYRAGKLVAVAGLFSCETFPAVEWQISE